MVPAWHPEGTEVHNLGRWQILEFNRTGWVDFVELFADFTLMLQLLISAPPFYKETNNNMFLRRNQSARCFIGCVREGGGFSCCIGLSRLSNFPVMSVIRVS